MEKDIVHVDLPRKKIVKRPLLFGIIASLVVALVAGGFAFSKLRSRPQGSPNVEVLAQTNNRPGGFTMDEEAKNIGVLLMGYGGPGHDGGYLIDAIQLAYIDFEKVRINLISIPRDLWVTSLGSKEMKINGVVAANSSGKKGDELIQTGAPVLKNIVAQVTGLPVDYYMAVDFVGLDRAIGITLDGIDVEIAETLDDPWYPIRGEEQNLCGKSPEEMQEVHAKYSGFELERQFECRYEHLVFEKGTERMEGGDALKYVRSRHGSAEGDISRGRRQQEVLLAIRKKLFSINALDKLPGFFDEMIKNVHTDVDLGLVEYLQPMLEHSNGYEIKRINLATTNVLDTGNIGGAAVLLPKAGNNDWTQTHGYILEEMGK